MKKLFLLIPLLISSLLVAAQQIDTAEVYNFINDEITSNTFPTSLETILAESDQEILIKYFTHENIDSLLLGITGDHRFDSLIHILKIKKNELEIVKEKLNSNFKMIWDKKRINTGIVIPLDSCLYFQDAIRSDKTNREIAEQKMIKQYGMLRTNVYSIPIIFHHNTIAIWAMQWKCFSSKASCLMYRISIYTKEKNHWKYFCNLENMIE